MCHEDSILVPLTAHGLLVDYVRVDAADVPYVRQWNWRPGPEGYATRTSTKNERREHTILLHRELMRLIPGDGWEVDHVNRNRLDCRRSNMRLVTKALNRHNVSPRIHSSRYRGVSWSKVRALWIAQAKWDGRVRNLGGYPTEEEAAAVAHKARLTHMSHAVD